MGFGQFIGLLIISFSFAAIGILYHVLGYLFWILISVTYYVFIEELLKLFFSLKSRDSVEDPVHQITKSHTITSTATGLGYSMCTGIIWTGFAAFQLNKDDEKDHDEYPLFGWLFLVTLIIAIIGMPMHLITGYITGCKITQKDIEYSQRNEVEGDNGNRLPFRSYIKVIGYSIFIRSAYLYFLIVGCLVFQFNFVGVIVALLGIIFDYVLLIKHAKLIESTLPFDYLQRAGQLSIFGYNVLASGPANSGNHHLVYNNPVDDRDDSQIKITAASFGNFSVNLDDPMCIENKILSNNESDHDEEMQYKECDMNDNNKQHNEEEVDLRVPHDILSLSPDEAEQEETGNSDQDSHSTLVSVR